MGNDRSRLGLGAVVGYLAGTVCGCSGSTPPNSKQAPDLQKITVFFPIDSFVNGHGDPGALPPPSKAGSSTFLEVNAHPTGTSDHFTVNDDGSFDFAIISVSGDILELAATSDDVGHDKGDVSYIRVPPGIGPRDHYLCCGAPSGTCQREEDAQKELPCPDPTTGAPRCATDRDCSALNGEVLPIDPMKFSVSSPDTRGKISIQGTTKSPGALVHVENRGKAGVGGENRGVKTARVLDSAGAFKIDGLTARGDDELVFQLMDLRGNLSPEMSVLVPNVQLKYMDILGAYAFTPFNPGKRGTVAVRFRPTGIDGYGICPESTVNPILCFGGGLDFSMVSFNSVNFDCGDAVIDSTPTATTSLIPNNRATEGDPVAGSVALMVVLDESSAVSQDTMTKMIDAAGELVDLLPRGTPVGLVSYGGTPAASNEITNNGLTASVDARTAQNVYNCVRSAGGSSTQGTGGTGSSNAITLSNSAHLELSPTTDSQMIHDTLSNLRTRVPTGSSDVYAGVVVAAHTLESRKLGPSVTGVILTLVGADITTQGQAPCIQAVLAEEAVSNPSGGNASGFPTYVVGISLTEQSSKASDQAAVTNVQHLQDIAHFAPQGSFTNLGSVNSLASTLTDLNGALSGDYVLLYDMTIPACVGKSAKLTLDVTTQLPGASTSTRTVKGPFTIVGQE